MYPELLRLGPLTLHTYGALLAVAFLVGLWLATRQARRAGLDATRVADMGVYVLIAGLVGARLLLLAVNWKYYTENWRELLGLLQSGGVFYGGLLGALPVAFWLMRRYALPAWATADALAPGVIAGQAIGRLGCLAAGCCYGRPANVPWAVTFRDVLAYQTVGTPMDQALHPTQLYESLAAGLILVVLLWLAPRKRFQGQVLCAYLALYAVARFAIEFYRGDERGTILGSAWSTSQGIAAALFVLALALWPYLARRQRVAAPAPAPAA